jgi:hypothetical protein
MGSFYAVRMASSGKLIGSRVMTEAEAEREVSCWRENIGRAGVVPADAESTSAVRKYDQDALAALLAVAEGTVWVSTTSHRSRDRLRFVTGDPGREFGIWPEKGTPHGAYYEVPARFADLLRKVKGLRVLGGEPSGGRLFRRLTHVEMGGPEPGNWQVPS